MAAKQLSTLRAQNKALAGEVKRLQLMTTGVGDTMQVKQIKLYLPDKTSHVQRVVEQYYMPNTWLKLQEIAFGHYAKDDDEHYYYPYEAVEFFLFNPNTNTRTGEKINSAKTLNKYLEPVSKETLQLWKNEGYCMTTDSENCLILYAHMIERSDRPKVVYKKHNLVHKNVDDHAHIAGWDTAHSWDK